MALQCTSVATGAAAVALVTPTVDTDGVTGRDVWVRNVGSADIFIGPAGVTTGAGFPVAINTTHGPMRLLPGETLFGISAAAQTMKVLQAGA